ncbi:MAG TPA: hypothetical protein VGQ35_13745 [Dongiaceae bacterium]|jgi:hypothetical protein|nr:hypothetical protein [Dongiaceae bacterium]
MVDRTQSLEGDAGVGDILVKIRGRHYLIPAEAIGSPLEDGGTEILGMLEKELSALGAARDSKLIGVDFAVELGEGSDRDARAITDDRNARAISARQSRQCVRQSRQCARQSRQCTRAARAIRPQAV